ncbi:hypothetical protein K443DRAFT_170592 [Laccaria amethystina LaAM-08-1]|uniref:Uncharacterized protein n=1 Tax=Laccaria amethystina LaAM-08-1 TaxID=1095629 RepID=A0A0C9WP07_9AGAR|nr:hypothetical protein K443DRAFT_170592 [Laccaria amethystina LaAM-08-1]
MPEQHDTSLSASDPWIHRPSRGDIICLTLASQAGLLSLISFLFLLFFAVRNAIHWRRRRGPAAPMRTWRIFQKPMYTLLLCFIGADILQTIGSAMDLKWVRAGHLAQVGEFPFWTQDSLVRYGLC